MLRILYTRLNQMRVVKKIQYKDDRITSLYLSFNFAGHLQSIEFLYYSEFGTAAYTGFVGCIVVSSFLSKPKSFKFIAYKIIGDFVLPCNYCVVICRDVICVVICCVVIFCVVICRVVVSRVVLCFQTLLIQHLGYFEKDFMLFHFYLRFFSSGFCLSIYCHFFFFSQILSK